MRTIYEFFTLPRWGWRIAAHDGDGYAYWMYEITSFGLDGVDDPLYDGYKTTLRIEE